MTMVMAENLVHHFYKHHEGFMQPTLVENQHHLDYKFSDNGISELRAPRVRLCGFAADRVDFRFLMKISSSTRV
jgi:hypothetical protein